MPRQCNRHAGPCHSGWDESQRIVYGKLLASELTLTSRPPLDNRHRRAPCHHEDEEGPAEQTSGAHLTGTASSRAKVLSRVKGLQVTKELVTVGHLQRLQVGGFSRARSAGAPAHMHATTFMGSTGVA